MTRAMKQPRKDVLRDQLVAAADEKIRLLRENAMLRSAVLQLADRIAEPTFRDRLKLTVEVVLGGILQPFRDLAMAARWLRRWWARVWG